MKLILLLFIIFFFSCADDSVSLNYNCLVDSDCKEGLYCENNNCVINKVCSTSVDCHIDQHCSTNNICVKDCSYNTCNENEICDINTKECKIIKCQTDFDCENGFYCNLEGNCETKEYFCIETSECFNGYHCENSYCLMNCNDSTCQEGFYCNDLTGFCENIINECSTDSECDPNFKCENNQCVIINVECEIDSDCSNRFVCVNNTCIFFQEQCVYNSDCEENSICIDWECVPISQCTDIFEENDSFETAKQLIETNNYLNITISSYNEDYYYIDYDGLKVINIDFLFFQDDGDIDIKIYQNGLEKSEVASGDDNENITISPNQFISGKIYFKVYVYPNHRSPETECQSYKIFFNTSSDVCVNDILESNDTFSEAISIARTVDTNLVICDNDIDMFKIDLSNSSDRIYSFNLYLNYLQENGNIKVSLIKGREIIFESDLLTGTEIINAELTSGAAYFLKVEGESGFNNNYTIEYTLNDIINNCVDDEFESNNEQPAGFSEAIYTGIYYLSICSEDVDWIPFQLSRNQTISIIVNFNNSIGDLDIKLYRYSLLQLEEIQISNSNSDFEEIEYTFSNPNSVGDNEYLYLKVFGNTLETVNSYTLNVQIR